MTCNTISDPRIGEPGLPVEYTLARSAASRGSIFAMRYRAYRRDGAITASDTQVFFDRYDTLANARLFAVMAGEAMLASIRVHFLTAPGERSPAADAFPEAVAALSRGGARIVDPSRFVTDRDAARRHPDLALLTLRVPLMACHAAQADWCIVAVRPKHAGFYQRLFGARLLSDPRPYPGLAVEMCALGVEVERMRAALTARHPDFPTAVLDRWADILAAPLPVLAATARSRASAG